MQYDKFVFVNTTTLAINLRRVRDQKGLTQAEVAERAGISRIAYRNIETGMAAPRASTLTRLVAVLGVKTADLMTEVRTLQAVRFRQNRRIRREPILDRVSRWLEAYTKLEGLLGQKNAFTFAKAKINRQLSGIDGAKRAAEAARRCVGLQPEESIRDFCELLEANGVKVYPFVHQAEGFFGLSVAKSDGGPAIAVNVWDQISVERWIFTAAHELGHLLLHLDAYRVESLEENETEEKEADVFASYFLMHQEAFEGAWHEARGLAFVERVFKVKQLFRVSYQTVLHRVQDTTSLGKSAWSRFREEYRKPDGSALAKTEEPHGLKPPMVEPHTAHEPYRLSQHEFSGGRLKLLVRDGVEKELISIGRGAEILGLDLMEMRKLVASWVE